MFVLPLHKLCKQWKLYKWLNIVNILKNDWLCIWKTQKHSIQPNKCTLIIHSSHFPLEQCMWQKNSFNGQNHILQIWSSWNITEKAQNLGENKIRENYYLPHGTAETKTLMNTYWKNLMKNPEKISGYNNKKWGKENGCLLNCPSQRKMLKNKNVFLGKKSVINTVGNPKAKNWRNLILPQCE
jgi:hypothetical protein